MYTSTGEAGRGIVLVNERGDMIRDCDDADAVTVTVRMANVSSTSATGTTSSYSYSSSSGRRRRGSGGGETSADASLFPDAINNDVLARYVPMAFVVLVCLRVVFAALASNFLLLVGLAASYAYASSNIPSNDSFDAKKELKRTMRGDHLPAEDRPRNFIERGLNRLAASVSTELVTSLGYEVSMTDCMGAATLACVTVPCNGMEYYWIGIVGE